VSHNANTLYVYRLVYLVLAEECGNYKVSDLHTTIMEPLIVVQISPPLFTGLMMYFEHESA
jgi:hypothetical protein